MNLVPGYDKVWRKESGLAEWIVGFTGAVGVKDSYSITGSAAGLCAPNDNESMNDGAGRMKLHDTSRWMVLLSFLGLMAISAGKAQATGFDRCIEELLKQAQSSLEQDTQLWVDRSQWENAWEIRTAHYQIRYAGDRAKAEAYGRLLEIMYGYYEGLLGAPPQRAEPMTVLIFPTLDAYNQFSTGNGAGPESSKYGGYYNTSDPRTPAVTYDFSHDLLVRRWLIHATTHQYLGQRFSGGYANLDNRNLAWVSYGLACYFETFQDYDGTVNAFRNLLSRETYIPLRDVLKSNIAGYGQVHFDELALFFFYMIHVREETKTVLDEDGVVESAPFRDYLVKLLNQVDVTDDPLTKMLNTSLFAEELASLEKEFKAYSY